ncbi:MAG: sigma-70 family RNA polymerase sigma factor [Fimbriiglobus sp.]|nr:sigma-70 family RNA polymerase sigma factor [Fimbriiglobus sp.]
MTLNDRQLLANFTRGDQSAFAALVERHGPLVWGVCRRATSSESLAEDAFQAVFVVLARRAKGLHLRTSLANWLFGVACKVANRAAQREYRRKLRERSAARPADHSATEADRTGPEWADTLRVLDEELAKLSEKYCGPLVACYLQGKTQDEAAAELGWTVFTLRRRLAAARDLLRERLTRRGAALFVALFAGAVFANTGFTTPPPAGLPARTAATATSTAIPTSVASLAGTSAVPVVLTTCVIGLLAMVGLVFAFGPSPAPTPATAALPAPSFTAVPPPATPPPWVTVRGRVTWAGNIPNPEVLNVTGADQPACCANGPLTSNQLLIHPASRGVKNVVVWLRPDADDRTTSWPKAKVHPDLRNAVPRQHILDQPQCQFEPRVIAAREGDSLLVGNSSAIRHNVTFSDRWAVEFDRTLSASEWRESGPLSADRIPAVIRCGIHPWMLAHLRVFDHPYFAVTDTEGHWEIKLAPAGRCRVVYWHELGFHRGKAGALGWPTELTTEVIELSAVELDLPKP